MRNWLKRIWSRIWGDVIIRKAKPTPSRDKLIYGHERNSLRDRFNRVRAGCGCPSTRDFSGGRRLDLTGSYTDEQLIERLMSGSGHRCIPYTDYTGSYEGYNVKYWALDGSGLKSREEFLITGSCEDYNLRFNLANMVEDTIVPVRERSGSV